MKFLTTQQAAESLNVTTRRVQQLCESGELKAERVGRDYLIDPKDVEKVRVRAKPGWKKGRKRGK